MPNNRQNNLFLFTIPFIVTFIAYLKTVCPTVYSGDSGELSLASAVLGIAHPPGYPLLTLMGRAFLTLVPINPAHALNILSALLAAGATGVAALVFHQILVPKSEQDNISALVIPSMAAILFGFSNSLWATAVGYEVYSLGALLFLLSLYCLLKFLETNRQYFLIASGYFLFLGLTDHLSIAVMGLPILYALISRKVPFRIWILLGSLFLLAISAYLYIPVRSSLNPIADWNHPANFKAFYEHVTAKRYHEYITGIRLDNYGENLWRSIVIMADQFPAYLAIVGLAGIVLTRQITKTIKIILIAIVLFNLLMAALYDIPDIDQYYLPSIFVSIIGLASLLLWGFRKLTYGKIISICVIALILVITTIENYPANNQANNRLAFIYGMDVLNSVPQNSYLISVGDNANSSIYYLHYVEGVRPDLEIYDIVKTVQKLKVKLHETSNTAPDGTDLCLKLMASNPDKSYLVKEHLLIRGQPFDYYNMAFTPQGLVYRWGKWPQDKSVWNRLELPTLSSFSSKLEFRGLTMLCNLNLSKGEDILAAGDTTRAQEYFKAASDVAALSQEASIHNSIGIFLRHLHQTQLAFDEYTKALNSHHLTAFERANIYVNLGNLRKDANNFDDAIGFYNKAIEINDNNTNARYNLALAKAYQNANRNRYHDAAVSFEEAITYPGADPGILYNLGSIYDQELADTVKAVAYYRRFIELVPNFPESAMARRRIQELSR